MAKYPYARWAGERIKQLSPEYQEEARNSYFSNSGRIAKYDEYARWCRLFGYDFDNCPDGYWESKSKSWHKGFGTIVGTLGVWWIFLLTVIVGAAGQRQRDF